MVLARCVDPCPPNPVENIPGVEPPPFPGGGGAGTIVTVDSPTVTFSGNGSADDPLTANLVLQPEGIAETVQLVSTSYGALSVGELQMVYSLPEDITFRENFEGSTGTVSPGLNASFDVQADGVSIGSVSIAGTMFAFTGAEITVPAGSVLKLVGTEELSFDYLSISMLGLIAVNFIELGA